MNTRPPLGLRWLFAGVLGAALCILPAWGDDTYGGGGGAVVILPGGCNRGGGGGQGTGGGGENEPRLVVRRETVTDGLKMRVGPDMPHPVAVVSHDLTTPVPLAIVDGMIAFRGAELEMLQRAGVATIFVRIASSNERVLDVIIRLEEPGGGMTVIVP